MKSFPHLHVPSDKTKNIYAVTPDTYNRLADNAITAKYKKVDDTALTETNLAGKEIATSLKLDDRTEPLRVKSPHFTLKVHKNNFENKPSVRLINPTKSDIGSVSKKILDRILPKIHEASPLPLWNRTSEAITWFRDLPDKSNTRFLQLDIEEYYASISESLLIDAINFARTFSTITEAEQDEILHAQIALFRKSTDEKIQALTDKLQRLKFPRYRPRTKSGSRRNTKKRSSSALVLGKSNYQRLNATKSKGES
ncbi:Hypothetical predicted protein [Octopus vulgaris]|uniref:Uncharacterized protein n=1 Tax=Octopus vulgaris TaxID=6645 RepID=A0AA36FFB8_OCTVU|nr:Hypothetical predicted protein [Octopus vulgaris]